jgi:hypothetical protein
MRNAPPDRNLPAGLASLLLLLLPLAASAQTVVELDLASATRLLEGAGQSAAVPMLRKLANNERQFTNVRVVSREEPERLRALATALRMDHDGSGSDYIPEFSLWRVTGQTGARVLLAASLMSPGSVLLSTDLDFMKGMLAYEILDRLQNGLVSLGEARRQALALGIEVQVLERDDGERVISFFGHGLGGDHMIGKLMVFEPMELALH